MSPRHRVGASARPHPFFDLVAPLAEGRVDVLSGDQAARLGVGRAAVRRAERARLVRVQTVMAAEPGPLDAPVAHWSPGDVVPDLAALSRLLRRRHVQRGAAPVTVIRAIPRAVAMFGGPPLGTPMPFQCGHALGVSEAYLAYVRAGGDPEAWVSERALSQAMRDVFHGFVPDAVIVGDDGRIAKVVDYGADYSTGRLEALHSACSAARLQAAHDACPTGGIAWEVW